MRKYKMVICFVNGIKKKPIDLTEKELIAFLNIKDNQYILKKGKEIIICPGNNVNEIYIYEEYEENKNN